MLCQFTVRNFKSYRDDTVLDMQAANIEEFSDSLIPGPGKNFSSLLPVSVIYGPNGGGKSNLFEAISCLVSCVMAPITASKPVGNPFGMLFTGGAQPFRFDESSSSMPTEFEIFFRTSSAQYQYRLSLKGAEIIEESLHCIKIPCVRRRVSMLFERTGGNIVLGSSIGRANTRDISTSIPYLSFLAINYQYSEISDVIEWFSNCCIINYSVSGRDKRFPVFLNEPQIKDAALNLLDAMDIPIKDYSLHEIQDESGQQIVRVETAHMVNGKTYQLSLGDESDGTCKIFSVLPAIMQTLVTGSPFLVDELDSKLHPQLLRFLIQLYMDPRKNTSHAQLIFTCQDISIMKNDLLRRDEIWFSARDEQSVSRLWSLYDIRDEKGLPVKNTAAYDKQYMAGRYGADPYLRQMIDWRPKA